MIAVDLSAATEDAAKAFHTFVITEEHAAEDAPVTWDDIDDEGKDILRQAVGAALEAAAPHIEKAVRAQACAELAAWAAEIPEGERLTGPRATRYRTLMAAARKVVPPMTTEEVAAAIKRGDYAACYLDDAGGPVARDPASEVSE